MNLADFKKHKDWVKVWSGRWSLHFDSHVGDDWTKYLKVSGKPVFTHVIYFYKNGITDCWVSQSEKDFLGQRFCNEVHKNPKFIVRLCRELKSMADEATKFLRSHNPEKMSVTDINKFWNLAARYYLPHLSVKYMVDYLSPQDLEKYLPILEDARLYAEQIFRNTEDFFEELVTNIGKGVSYTRQMLLATTGKEMDYYFKNGKLPNKKLLKKRFISSSLLVKRAQHKLVVGKSVSKIEQIVSVRTFNGLLRGQAAYKGKVVGRVRIVWQPTKVKKFNKGDILVTGMTRPEFLPLMKKASCFVTDAGGILSHAAIMARELRKPCVIGTKMATKFFKDGDKVEVDADKGIVRKL